MADEVTKDNLNELENFVRDINRILDEISNRDYVSMSFRAILNDKNLMARFNKKWIAHNLLLNIFNSKTLLDFSRELHENIEKIEALDPELAEKLRALKVPSPQQIEELWHLLPQLQQILAKESEYEIVANLEVHGSFFIENLRKYGDLETSRAVERLIHLITQEEVLYLRKHLNEVLMWPNQVGKQNIQFFIQRLLSYLRGGIVGYKGLISYFKDAVIMKEVREGDVLKKLATYNEQLNFFNHILQLITRGIKEANWEDFRIFWKNRRKYEERIKHEFGDPLKFAEIMRKDEKDFRQSPLLWIAEIRRRLRVLQSDTYINNNVIIPAARELIIIFESRIKGLEGKRTEATVELRKFVDKRIIEIEHFTGTLKERLGKLVRKTRSKLLNKWEKDKIEFRNKEDATLMPRLNFIPNLEEVFRNFNLYEKALNLEKITNLKLQWGRYLYQNFKITDNPDEVFPVLGKVWFGSGKLDDLNLREFMTAESLTKIDTELLGRTKKLTAHAKKRIIPKIDVLTIYIKEKLEAEFIIEVNQLRTMIQLRPVPKKPTEKPTETVQTEPVGARETIGVGR